MSDATVSGTRRRNLRSVADSGRAAALERLQSIRRSGGRRSEVGSAIHVKLDEPIYDTVEEEEYLALKARRKEDAEGFIVDDDGLGYVDEGQEEDWARSGLPPSSDEDGDGSDGEGKGRRRKKKKRERKEVVGPKKAAPTSLTAAAALMGKHKLSAMFTSSSSAVLKRSERVKGSESIVDDLIAEFAPDEADREERRRRRLGSVQHPQAAIPVQYATSAAAVTGFNRENPCSGQITKIEAPSLDVEVGLDTAMTENDEAENRNDTYGSVAEGENARGSGRVALSSPPFFKKKKKEDENTQDSKAGLNLNETANAEMDTKGDLKVDSLLKHEKVYSLNAKVKVPKDDNVTNATAGWKAVCKGDGDSQSIMEAQNAKHDEKFDTALDTNGPLPFYLIDIHEESYGSNSGTLYLFGKVKAGSAYQSCCLIVKNMQRCIYAIPNDSVFQNNEIIALEKSVADSQISMPAFRIKLQEMATELKSEIAKSLVNHNVSSFSMMPVKRGYAFERTDVPKGEQYALKINYPFKDPPLPSDLKGELFNVILGTSTSALEHFIVKRKIKGPSWLSISKFSTSSSHESVSFCKFELVVDFPKDICLSTSKTMLEIPPVIVTAINLKTIINEKNSTNEIVSASVICCHKAKIDGPMMASELRRSGVLSSFTILRKLEGGILPLGFMKKVDDKNSREGMNALIVEHSERALLNCLMNKLCKLDTDVLVGHNISGFDLDVLLYRAQVCKVPSGVWSRIGRLKRSMMPKLTKGTTLYGSGASPGIMSCIAGRLLCDTYLCSRDLLKEASYSLTELSRTQLNKNREEIVPHDIPAKFQSSESLLQLVDCGETDAWLSLELMFHLSILPLTRQLTNISGNLWGKTLQGARAQRVEYLLLHAFHAKKYIVPDKSIGTSKASIATKRRLASADVENRNDLHNDGHIEQVKSKKGPAYAGGLVLEPKKGLYDKFVLLLDFNSLYPSIIQEYNICFTTIERSLDGLPSCLPSSTTTGVLPELLKNLVERRKMVKSWFKTASGLKAQQFDIQQQALKLTANSLYGCLGFTNSRFYAKPIAELITSQGRDILQSTVDLVQNVLNLEVIYGDTDSIMIYSGLDDITKARAMATKVIQEVNKKYRRLEIDLDGLYKRMLLLKKKKYAAVKVQFKDGKPYEVIERKGLDIVRRDWSLLAKESGETCLCQILSGGSCDDVVEMIHSYLMKVQEDVRNGEIELEKYVIRKTLTKPPEEYPDGRNQAHVQVALRMKQSGYSTGCSAGDTISYVICCDQGAVSSSGGIAERARHPDELKTNNGSWIIDIEYYLSQQIHPVVSRLCAFIQGTDPARLADCLGLDSSKFQHKTSESITNDPSSVLVSVLDADDRYHGCEPLRLTCQSCSSSFDCPPILNLLSTSSDSNPKDFENNKETNNDFWHRLCCPRCPEDAEGSKISSAMIANQVKRQAENLISLYYKGLMICDDEMCKHTTRSLNLRVLGDSERGTVCPNYPQCNGHLTKQYTEAEVYKQLSYFCHIFDAKHCIEKLDSNGRILFEKELKRIYPIINLPLTTAQKIRDRCAYGWVQLNDLSVSV